VLQCLYGVLHQAIENVRAKHQPKVPHLVHLTEEPEMPLVSRNVVRCIPSWLVVETNGIRSVCEPATAPDTTKIKFSVYDDDIKGCRRCGGENGFEEIRRGARSSINGLRSCLEGPKGSVPRQIEMLKQRLVIHYESITWIYFPLSPSVKSLTVWISWVQPQCLQGLCARV